jgi:hypothetical protein
MISKERLTLISYWKRGGNVMLIRIIKLSPSREDRWIKFDTLSPNVLNNNIKTYRLATLININQLKISIHHYMGDSG